MGQKRYIGEFLLQNRNFMRGECRGRHYSYSIPLKPTQRPRKTVKFASAIWILRRKNFKEAIAFFLCSSVRVRIS
jgi:hypothetical protein